MMEATEDRAVRRALRLLQGGDARLCKAAIDGQALLEAGERGTLGISFAALKAMRESGLVAVEGDAVRLVHAAAKVPDDAADAFHARPRKEGAAVMPADDGMETVTVNLAESPLGLLWQRKNRKGERFLTTREFAAGERLRADYTRGQIMPRLGVNWSAAGTSGRKSGDANGIAGMTDAALAARRRVERAIDAVGPELSGVLIDICCFLKGFELVEAERGWPARSAKVVLKSALAALARHYEPPRAAAAKTTLHWGAEGYRPVIG